MKSFSICLASAAAVLAGVALAPASAATKCDNPNGSIEQRACAKAAEGPDALRRFVTRTASIYALSYFDFARGDAALPATSATAKP